ncbi:MAG: VOC family protein [Candidatus Acidiferrales bacterium]
MPKRSPAAQLDRAIEAMLIALQPEPEPNPSPALVPLMPIARALRDLPRPNFKAALKSDLQRRTTMNDAAASAPQSSRTAPFRRPGFNNIAPYIIVNGAAKLMDFLISSFEGAERIRVPKPDGSIMHAEVGIGDSVVELGDPIEQYPPRSMTTHLYVPDSDTTFARALQAGATSIYAPTDDHPSGDRWGAARDPFGNVWYIATPKGWKPGPEGLRAVQPYLHLRDAHKMIPFIEAAFGAEALGVHKSPEGRVLHATISIANATFEIDEAHGEFQPMPCYLHVYVPDTDALYAQAIRAGAISVTPPNNAPYGDRAATVKDPFGNTWFLATYLGISQP